MSIGCWSETLTVSGVEVRILHGVQLIDRSHGSSKDRRRSPVMNSLSRVTRMQMMVRMKVLFSSVLMIDQDIFKSI